MGKVTATSRKFRSAGYCQLQLRLPRYEKSLYREVRGWPPKDCTKHENQRQDKQFSPWKKKNLQQLNIQTSNYSEFLIGVPVLPQFRKVSSLQLRFNNLRDFQAQMTACLPTAAPDCSKPTKAIVCYILLIQEEAILYFFG